MANTRILQLGDPKLRLTSKEVPLEDITNRNIQNLISHMKQVLDGIRHISSENGNALSAPQVDQPVRLVLLRLKGVFTPMVNPVLTPLSEKRFAFQEECFSFYQLRGEVRRFEHVKVDYYDEYGQAQSRNLTGEYAGLIQHEVDHLDGILFLDQITDNSTIRSIEFEFKDHPERLTKVTDMLAYMSEVVPNA